MHTFRRSIALDSSRPSSEDRAAVFEPEGQLVVIVADGAGGIVGGQAAADAVLHAVRDAAPEHDLDASSGGLLLRKVDDALAATMTGETTAVLVVLHDDGLTGASVGDSCAWIVTQGGVDDVTADQDRARLGSGRARPVPFARAKLDGTLVLATDGLWKYASRDRIAEVVRSVAPEDAAARLVELMRLRSGSLPDDVAVVVVGACPTPL